MTGRSLSWALAASLMFGSAAVAQCRGGGAGPGTIGGTANASGIGAVAGTTAGLTGGQLLTGPGSLAADMLMSQMIAQQVALRQALLAQQQQKIKDEKLTTRRYRAEQTRAQVAASRARTRAALAAQNGMTLPKSADLTGSVAYQAARR